MKRYVIMITLLLFTLTITPAFAQVPDGEEYIVQADDWLSTIAEKEYGNPLAYPAIVEATNAKAAEDNSFAMIDDPGVIEVGQKLWLPTEAEGTAMAETTPATPAEFGAAWQSVPCDTFDVVPDFASLMDCGYVTVPENRAAGGNATIQLAVVRVPTDAEIAGSPVILGTGGPGSNGLASAANSAFFQSHADILADRDWVFFSQRGTKYAQPYLACPEYDAVPFEAALNNVSDEDRRASQLEAMQTCYDAFVAEGIDLSAYNTTENAADIVDIKQALGYDQIIYYGQSYGTVLGQFLLRNNPEILEAAILDGIAPATATHWSDVTNYRDAFQRVFEACAADEACSAEYPDPEGTLAEVIAGLNDNPQPLPVKVDVNDGQTGTVQLDGLLAMNGLFIQLYTPGGYSLVPTLAYQMQDGDFSALSQVVPLTLNSRDNARVMHFAVACTDDPINSLDDLNIEDFAEMYTDLALDDANGYITYCPLLNVTQLPDSSDGLVTSDVPTLLLQGALDPATPVAGGNNVATGLSNSYNIVFPTGTHIQEHDPCGLAMMDAFMTDPLTEPDTSCINPELTFAVPRQVTVTSDDGVASISMQLPAGFQDTAGGYSSPPVIVTLQALPPQAPEAAITNLISAVGLPENEIVDGDPVAGQPTKRYQAEGVPIQGFEFGFDIITLADDAGTYVIFVQNQAPDNVEPYRQEKLPAMLESVSVGGQ
jgi:pimeloyl-ACP methyl ester carboxylesterase